MSATAVVLGADPTNVWQWFGASELRRITGPIPSNLWITLWHALVAGAAAVALAVPPALYLAHRRKGEVLASWLVGLGRIVPTVTLLAIFVVISLRKGWGFEPWPIVAALTILAVPPIFANTYTAVVGAPADAVAAGRAMGLTEGQIMRQIELPLALPLILTGVRVALTQLVATEALGPLFGGKGLGLYIRFGFANKDIYAIQGGALLVAGTAMAVDLLMWLLSRFALPRGVRVQARRRGTTSRVSRRLPVGTASPAPT